jgi:LacI family transcriptional regulator
MLRSKTSPTIVDIAQRLGISPMTVSRALNGKADVREEVRKKVVQCADALGYQPNRWARSLVTQRSFMIGVVVPEITHSFFAEIIGGVEDVLDKAGYDILLCHSRNDPARERSEIQALIGGHIDALIVAPVQPSRSPGIFQDLQKRRGSEVSVGLLRRRGFTKALRTHGLDTSSHWTLRAGLTIEGGHSTMEKLLRLEPHPTAVFAANDPQAIGAIYACREAGLQVPKDISIVGAGNIEGDYHLNPFLTTIDWPRQQLGQIAAAFVLNALKSDDLIHPELHVFKPKLLVRHSTASPISA